MKTMRRLTGMNVKRILALGIIVLLASLLSSAGDEGLRKPGKGDKCPVCGMFVSQYPDFLARVVFQDSSILFFDGAKDLFKYLLAPSQYSPGKKHGGITAVYVTGYYRLTPIDARKAFYVPGSDVYGPMGRELIPFEKESEAREFMSDHQGKAMLRYDGVTAEVIRGID